MTNRNSTKKTVAEKRNYRVLNVELAKIIALEFVKKLELENAIKYGLPEIDDRYHIWRVPLKSNANRKIGEIVIDAYSSLILEKKTTKKEILEASSTLRTL